MKTRPLPKRNWLLPEFVEDILPPEASRIEGMRQTSLELFRVHGFALVAPPLMEYLESLLTGTGRDLDLRTFKLVDQLSGRLMGLRADITPQVARIDAHLLNRDGVTRLCYAGSVLHTLPVGLTGTREPLQVGAEIYGHAGVESDIEIQELLLKALGLAGVAEAHLDLGHVGLFRSLVEGANLAPERQEELFGVLQAKDASALDALTRGLEAKTRAALALLPTLYGGAEVLDAAKKHLPAQPRIGRALADLRRVADRLGGRARLRFDLSDLRGYHYHSGIVFAAYAKGWPNAIALGGRYDQVGEAFGRARPATGFSMDLRELSRALPPPATASAILAPYSEDAGLRRKIDALRAKGEIVVVELPGHSSGETELNCDRKLTRKNGKWEVKKN